MTFGKGHHKIHKFSLAYHSKFTPWKKRATRGHERAAQKAFWNKEQRNER